MPVKKTLSRVQAVLFKVNKFNTKQARKRLKEFKLKPISRVRKTDKYLRYRIEDPNNFSKFRIKKTTDIDFIIGFV